MVSNDLKTNEVALIQWAPFLGRSTRGPLIVTNMTCLSEPIETLKMEAEQDDVHKFSMMFLLIVVISSPIRRGEQKLNQKQG